MEELLTATGGVLLGLVIKYFWDRWNKDCSDCEVVGSLKKSIDELKSDINTIKTILIELAIEKDLSIDKIKKLTNIE